MPERAGAHWAVAPKDLLTGAKRSFTALRTSVLEVAIAVLSTSLSLPLCPGTELPWPRAPDR